MTKDDIIRMAREAGLWPAVTDTFPNELEHFANLVAAAEREACAKVCDELAAQSDIGEAWIEECAFTIRERGAP